MKKNLFVLACVIALGVGITSGPAFPAAAQDSSEKKNPSDRTVRVIMGWAFAAVPETATREGKEVKLDRSDPKKFMIPLDDARRIIQIATRSANANLCDLPELEAKNFGHMMTKEQARGKWTPNQMLFIKHLHIATGLVMTGDFATGKETGENSEKTSGDGKREYNCPPEEQERVKASIEAYLQGSN